MEMPSPAMALEHFTCEPRPLHRLHLL